MKGCSNALCHPLAWNWVLGGSTLRRGAKCGIFQVGGGQEPEVNKLTSSGCQGSTGESLQNYGRLWFSQGIELCPVRNVVDKAKVGEASLWWPSQPARWWHQPFPLVNKVSDKLCQCSQAQKLSPCFLCGSSDMLHVWEKPLVWLWRPSTAYLACHSGLTAFCSQVDGVMGPSGPLLFHSVLCPYCSPFLEIQPQDSHAPLCKHQLSKLRRVFMKMSILMSVDGVFLSKLPLPVEESMTICIYYFHFTCLYLFKVQTFRRQGQWFFCLWTPRAWFTQCKMTCFLKKTCKMGTGVPSKGKCPTVEFRVSDT